MRKRSRSTTLEDEFNALGLEARQFHLHLKSQPVKTGVHLRRLMGLARPLRDDGAAGRHRSGPGAGGILRDAAYVEKPLALAEIAGGSANFPRPRYPLPGGAS